MQENQTNTSTKVNPFFSIAQSLVTGGGNTPLYTDHPDHDGQIFDVELTCGLSRKEGRQYFYFINPLESAKKKNPVATESSIYEDLEGNGYDPEASYTGKIVIQTVDMDIDEEDLNDYQESWEQENPGMTGVAPAIRNYKSLLRKKKKGIDVARYYLTEVEEVK